MVGHDERELLVNNNVAVEEMEGDEEAEAHQIQRQSSSDSVTSLDNEVRLSFPNNNTVLS